MIVAFPLILLLVPILIVSVLVLNDRYHRQIRQFSIRDLLFYIFLWAVCFSQVSAIRNSRDPFEHFAWRRDWIILIAWIVLTTFYVKRHDFTSLLIHSVGVLFFGSFFAICFALGGGGTWDEIGSRLSAGMFLSSFAGLAFFSIMTLLGMLRRVEPPPEKDEKE